MYGKDRLEQPLLRMKDGEFHKDGDFCTSILGQSIRRNDTKWKAALKKNGPTGVGMFGSGQCNGRLRSS
ncbi:hypothetical protein O9929_26880 [Vibrio lentus]|nr:hypothetical protein [Vibrio lentus]